MDSYRVEVKGPDEDRPADEGRRSRTRADQRRRRQTEPELDQLSNIIKAFNDQFGNIDWKDADKIRKVIAEEIPAKVAADEAYQNAMKNNDKQNARIEHDRALQRVMIDLLVRPHRAVQAVQRQPVVQEMAGRHHLRANGWGADWRSRSSSTTTRFGRPCVSVCWP
jgi:type I site-specific restriction-modification system R (restriction) subunit